MSYLTTKYCRHLSLVYAMDSTFWSDSEETLDSAGSAT